jgi:hypothetical protein
MSEVINQLGQAFSVALAVLFIFAASSKTLTAGQVLSDLPHFAKDYGKLAVALVVIIELALAASLLVLEGSYPLWGSAILLLVFTGYNLFAKYKMKKQTCMCFGSSSATTTGQAILRNLFLIVFCLVFILAEFSGISPSDIKFLSLINGISWALLLIAWQGLSIQHNGAV